MLIERLGGLRDAVGLPWGCVVKPFGNRDDSVQPTTSLSEIARCVSCFAYVNQYARFDRTGKWICPVCGTKNRGTSRYETDGRRAECPELIAPLGEYVFDGTYRYSLA